MPPFPPDTLEVGLLSIIPSDSNPFHHVASLFGILIVSEELLHRQRLDAAIGENIRKP